MLASPYMLPDILDFLFCERLQQIVFSSSTDTLKDSIWMFICGHHCKTEGVSVASQEFSAKASPVTTCFKHLLTTGTLPKLSSCRTCLRSSIPSTSGIITSCNQQTMSEMLRCDAEKAEDAFLPRAISWLTHRENKLKGAGPVCAQSLQSFHSSRYRSHCSMSSRHCVNV